VLLTRDNLVLRAFVKLLQIASEREIIYIMIAGIMIENSVLSTRLIYFLNNSIILQPILLKREYVIPCIQIYLDLRAMNFISLTLLSRLNLTLQGLSSLNKC
jgi:hypothetical protein